MATKEQAEDTYVMAKAFYVLGVKSSNKCYYGSGKVKSDVIDRELEKPLTEKQQKRNDQALKNRQAMLADARSYANNKGKTPYEIGKTLWEQGNTLGNCGEMAAVALYLAIDGVNVPANEVTHWTLRNNVKTGLFSTDTFGHSFAVLGDGTLANSWVVDPWADLWCRLSKFSDKLTDKLKYWTSVGKRIAAPTPEGTCWVEPTNDIITGILGKMAILNKVGAHEKGK